MNPRSAELLATLLEADYEYYTFGKSKLSDNEYDRMREEFVALEPTHPYVGRVGAPIPVDAKAVVHRIIAGSQEKIKYESDLIMWGTKCGTLNEGFVVQWKLDGSTLVLQYTDGCLVEAATRGDGVIGESVLFNAVNIPSIPKRLPFPFTGDVRGEVILSKSKFQKYFAALDYSNPRNSVAVIRDQKGTDLAQHLDFIAFDVIDLVNKVPFVNETGRLASMQAMGFTTVQTDYVVSAHDIWSTFMKFESERDAYDYEADGVVVRFNSVEVQESLGLSSDNRPKGQRSIKFANDEAETTIIDVEYTIGSTGSIIPTLKVNPVECGGVTIKSILANNFKYIEEVLGGVCLGDKCIIERAGGVIPHFVEVTPRYDHTTGKRLGPPVVAPATCPFCSGDLVVEGAHTRCKNDECEGRGFQKVMQWVTKRDIKGLGDVILQNLYDKAIVQEPADLYTMSENDLAAEVGAKTAKKIMVEIEKSKICPLNELMGSVCIKFLGRRECELIQEKCGIDTVSGWFNLSENDLLAVEGYKDRKATAIIEGIYQAKGIILDLLTAGVKPFVTPKEAPKPTQDGLPFSGQILLFTGRIDKCDAAGARYTRKKMQELAKKCGAQVVDDFDSSVTMLVTAELDSTSSKMKKAQKAGTRIVSEDEFFSTIS